MYSYMCVEMYMSCGNLQHTLSCSLLAFSCRFKSSGNHHTISAVLIDNAAVSGHSDCGCCDPVYEQVEEETVMAVSIYCYLIVHSVDGSSSLHMCTQCLWLYHVTVSEPLMIVFPQVSFGT